MRLQLFIPVLFIFLICGSCSKNTGKEKGQKDTVAMYYEFHDFESSTDSRLDSTKAFSGRKSAVLNDKIEYGFGLIKQVKDIPSFKNINEITVNFQCFMDRKYPNATMVFAIDDDSISKKSIYWEGITIAPSKYNAWVPVTIKFKVKKKDLKPEYFLKLYVWNKSKNSFNFDNVSYSFAEIRP